MKVCSVCQRCYEDAALCCPEENQESLVSQRMGSREIASGYRLDCLLESNEASESYRATNIPLNQSCIFRIFSARLDEQSQQQFLTESQAAAALNHPNLVCLLESGVLESGERYAVTESPAGQTLRQCLLNVNSISHSTALTITRQAAEGLQAAHTAGLVHRNINPENIFLSSDAENRLLVKIQNFDLGDVKQQAIASTLTDSDWLLNELKYWSPEQCAGEQATGLSDIYSLGIVLYEMIAGQPPFDSPDAPEIIRQQIHQTPRTPEINNFDIRALLTHTLMLSLQKVPTARQKTATAFARQLRHIEQLLTHAPIPVQAAPPPPSPVVSKPVAAAVLPQNNVTSGIIDNFIVQKKQSEPQTKNVPITVKSPLPAISLHAEKSEPETPVNGNQIIERSEPVVEQEKIIVAPPPVEKENFVVLTPSAPKPVLIEWDQPEDIPSEFETLEVLRSEFGETRHEPEHFSFESQERDSFEQTEYLSFEEEEEILSMAESAPRDLSIKESPRRVARENPIFSYETPRSAISIDIRYVKIAAGLTGFIFLALIGLFINQKFQTSASADKTMVKPEKADKYLTESPKKSDLKNETVISETAENEYPELPNFENDAPVKSKKSTPKVAKNDVEPKQSEVGADKEKQIESPAKEPTANETKTKQNAKLIKKPQAEKPKSTDPDALVRPRYVQNVVIHVPNN
jgi:serine/threonine protein kinase